MTYLYFPEVLKFILLLFSSKLFIYNTSLFLLLFHEFFESLLFIITTISICDITRMKLLSYKDL